MNAQVLDSRLARLVRPARDRDEAAVAPRSDSVCELCAAPIDAAHRHLYDASASGLRCVCIACSLLFDRPAAAMGRYRRVPDRVLRVEGFELPEERWAALAIPVGLAYLVSSSRLVPGSSGPEERIGVRGFYPGAMGAVESRLGLDAWDAIRADNPVLSTLEDDVEALLVRRLPSVEDYWIAPLDACLELVAVLRSRWRGLSGGEEVWREIDAFFERLESRASEVDPSGRRRSGR
jgi:hypothetical protein